MKWIFGKREGGLIAGGLMYSSVARLSTVQIFLSKALQKGKCINVQLLYLPEWENRKKKIIKGNETRDTNNTEIHTV